MAKDYVRGADPDQGFLMPVDMREWLPEDHPVWWFVSLVESLDMSAFEKVNRLGGAGRAAYDPRVLTAVLLYGYWNAQLSSRRLERLCQHDVGFRVLARGLAPDHSTLARFRQAHAEGLASVFAQVLVVCAQVGMVQLDTVAIDGTKIAADVSETSMADAARLETLATRARERAEQVIAAAEQVDAEEQTRFGDGVGDELPADLRQARARLAKIQALQQQLADREQVRAQAAEAMREQAAQYLKAVADPDQRIPHGHVPPMVDPVGLAEAKLARAQALAARKAAARTRGYRQGQDWQPAPVVKAREALVAAREHAEQNPKTPPRRNSREHRATKADRINITDPESVTMISSKGWVQGYNTQLAVSADQVIVAVKVTDQAVDVGLLEPMMTAAQHVASALVGVRPHRVDPRIGTVLADAGYLSKHNITCDGPDRLIAPGRARQSKPVDPHAAPPDKLTDPVGWMSARLRQPDTKTLYNQRGATVEPVNGHVKTIVGLRRFTCRGLQAAQTEATLAATALNIGKLIRHTAA